MYEVPNISVVAAGEDAARIFRRRDGEVSLAGEIIAPQRGLVSGGAPSGRMPGDAAFLGAVADWLEKETATPRFDRLVLLGAPDWLEALRRTVRQSVYARVSAEIHRDLSRLTAEDLRREAEKILWF